MFHESFSMLIGFVFSGSCSLTDHIHLLGFLGQILRKWSEHKKKWGAKGFPLWQTCYLVVLAGVIKGLVWKNCEPVFPSQFKSLNIMKHQGWSPGGLLFYPANRPWNIYLNPRSQIILLFWKVVCLCRNFEMPRFESTKAVKPVNWSIMPFNIRI